MKTLTEIKNEVAQDHGWDSYSQIEQAFRSGVISENSFDDFVKDLCRDYAQQACEDLRERIAENAKMKLKDNYLDLTMHDEWQELDRDSIRNTEIILP